jgi:hypothetical protein
MPQKFPYQIRRIKELSSTIREELYINDPQKAVKVELGYIMLHNFDHNLVNITLRVFAHYADEPNERFLADIHVQNVFEIDNLVQYKTESGIVFPFDILKSIFGISISHCRALFAKNLAGTPYQQIMLPISDVSEVVKKFFANADSSSTETEILKKSTPKKSKKNKI